MKITKEHAEVLNALSQYKDSKKAIALKKYMGTNLNVLGVMVPDQRKALKKGYSFLSKSDKEIRSIWNRVLEETNYFEVRGQAFLYYSARSYPKTKELFSSCKKWVKHIDNWEHSDRLSVLIADIRDLYPELVYSQLEKWNTSKIPWARRQSVVGLFAFKAVRKNPPSFEHAISLVRGVFFDHDIYVQKGVGWTLRELFHVYPKEVYAFLLDHAKEIHPSAWQAATEKLSKLQKQKLKQHRQAK